MTHHYEGSSLLRCRSRVGEAAICRRIGNYRLGNRFLVGIDDRSVRANLTQQRLCHGDFLKLVPVSIQRVHHLVVFRAVHQMGGLQHQLLDAVGHRPIQCLFHVVDGFAVPCLHMVNDDLGSKGPAHKPIREGRLQCVLDALDILHTTVVERGAEADHQNFLLANAASVQRIVQTGIAGIPSEVIRVGVLAFHQLLLYIGQSIPCGLGSCTLGIGVCRALLNIDGINQRSHFIRSCLIVHHGFGFLRGFCSSRGRSCGGLGRSGRCRAAAGTQQHCRHKHSGNQGTCLFLFIMFPSCVFRTKIL